MTISLGIQLTASGAAANVVPGDLPVLRRDVLQEDNFFVLLEDLSKLVITFGTFDSLLLEDATFLLREDSSKLIIQAN